jgi:hypothetical protein
MTEPLKDEDDLYNVFECRPTDITAELQKKLTCIKNLVNSYEPMDVNLRKAVLAIMDEEEKK